MIKSLFVVYFFSFGEGEVQSMKLFIERVKAEKYAVELGGKEVNKKFTSINEMEMWYQLDDGEERPGRIHLEEHPIEDE